MIGVLKGMMAGALIALPFPLASGTGGASASEMQLTAAEIRARIIGNTVVGVEDGTPYQEYFNPSGTIAGSNNTEKYSGAWRIDGNRLCMGYESDDDPEKLGDWTCSDVALVGDHVIWNDDGDLTTGKLLPGQR